MKTFRPTLAKIDTLISNGYQFRTPLYMGQAFELVKRNFGLFASFTMVYIAFLFLVWRLGETGSFLNLFVTGPVSAGFYLVIHKMVTGRALSFENFFDGFRIYLPVMVAAMASNLLISIGSLLFIVPGLLVAISLLFVMPLVVFGKLELFTALKSSQMIVWKQFWEVGKFGLFIGLINIGAIFTFGIGLLFTLPMSFAAIYFAYSDLIGINEETSINKPDFSHFR